MTSESKTLIFYVCDEEKQFHCVFPIKNKKNSLLTLIFKQITPNLVMFGDTQLAHNKVSGIFLVLNVNYLQLFFI